jgi:hypothetical protein
MTVLACSPYRAFGTATDSASATATMAAMRSVWKAAKPTRQDFGSIVSDLQSMQMVGEGSKYERWAHVCGTILSYNRFRGCYDHRSYVWRESK